MEKQPQPDKAHVSASLSATSAADTGELQRQLAQVEQLLISQQAMLDYYAEHTDALQETNDFLNAKYIRLQDIERSTAWRFGSGLMRVARKLFPSGAVHTRLLGGVARGAKRLFKRPRAQAGQGPQDPPAPQAQTAAPAAPAPEKLRLRKLVLPVWEAPAVSIILPAYNQFEYTYRCIESILRNVKAVPYEVVLADDNSTDRTTNVEKWIRNLRVVRNTENLRFLRNCNTAAAAARGRYLMFLNNDTRVHPNWLESLVALMEADGRVAIAGSKLVYPDGSLQEAGGIIWSDGSGWNYGRGQDPGGCEYNYLKEADYISGASILVRRSFWDEVGGFDERYAPAYCEDSDLCFEARRRGYKVVYQPLSVVTHYEGVTNGTDLSSGQKKYQIENQKKFFEKWKDVLQAEQYQTGTHLLRAKDRSRNKKLMLLADHSIPTYDMDAGSRTIENFIRMFVQDGWKVVLLPNDFRETPYARHYQQMGVEVLYGRHYRKNWQQWVLDNADEFDAALLHRPKVCVKYIGFLRAHTCARILYYGADLHFLREEREYAITKEETTFASAQNWRKLELALMRQADVALYPSDVEKAYIQNIDPSINVLTVPMYAFDTLQRQKYKLEGREDLLFVGGFNHPPNVDAVQWLAEEIMPAVWQQRPNIKLHVVGSNPTAEIKALQTNRFVIHGFASEEELQKLMRTCRLALAPLRFGAGIKGKIIEAMAQGLPVVTTPVGAEGIPNAEAFLAVENTAAGLAGRACALYDDADSLAHMCEKGYDCVEQAYSERALQEAFAKALA